MIQLTRKTRFSAAHRYYLEDLSEEENRRLFGLCALPHGHGHDYVAEVTVSGHVDPATGMVVNISELKPILQAEITDPLDGAYLTPAHPLLQGKIPSTEVLSRLLWDRLGAAIRKAELPAELERVRLAESPRLWSDCERVRRAESGKRDLAARPCRDAGVGAPAAAPTEEVSEQETPAVMVTLTRTYEFAAAHRLHSACLTEAENRDLFGKCNNLHGHGHNYLLEVTVGGEPDARTGLLVDLGELDRVVNEQVVERYDHRHLNFDIEEFRELNPTSENLVKVIWSRLFPALPAGTLRRVTLRETERNIFTYEGETE